MDTDLDLTIDPEHLDAAWANQAALMLEYGKQAAMAKMQADVAKARLAVVAAECDRQIRKDPQKYGLIKATEGTVPHAVAEHRRHQAAMEEYLNAKYEANVLQAVVDALQHRKASLQGYTDLWLRQWYADPHGGPQPQPLKRAAAETRDKETRAVVQQRRRKRRARE